MRLLLQFCRLHQSRLHSASGSRSNLETAGLRRPRGSHPDRPGHIVLVSDRWGEEARQPQTATGTEVRQDMLYSLVLPCWGEAGLQLITLCFLSQGQWGRLRNRLHRAGHRVAYFRDPQTNRAIDWYFALGGTNGPGPVGPNRHCPVQSHCCCSTSTKLDYETFSWHEIHSPLLFSQISKALLFVWHTTFECKNLSFLKVGPGSQLKLHRTMKCDGSMFCQCCRYWCYSLELVHNTSSINDLEHCAKNNLTAVGREHCEKLEQTVKTP